MSGTCNFLGIYANDIEQGGETFDAVCEFYGIDTVDAWDMARRDFMDRYGEQFSNIVNAMLMERLRIELAAIGIDYERTDYEVNGFIVDFIVDGEQV